MILGKKSKKHIRGGADTIFETGLRYELLEDFIANNEYIQNRNNIDNIKFITGSFVDSIIDNCKFNNCSFNNVVFRSSQINSVNFNNCNFKNISFINDCKLQNVNFVNCIVDIEDEDSFIISSSHADFCDFRNMNLTSCSFTDSSITTSDFRGTNLKDALFYNVDLTGITIDATTILEGTRFTNVLGLDNVQSDISTASFENAVIQNTRLVNNSPTNVNDYPSDDELSEVSSIATNIIEDPNDITIDNTLNLSETFNESTNNLKEELLRREPSNIQKYTCKSFNNLTKYDAITMEEINYCEYIKNPNNIIFLYNEQSCFTNKDQLDEFINTNIDNNKIIFQCKNVDEASTPRLSNIYENPQLNMDIFGIFGVMVPLQELDYILNKDYQVYIIQSNHYGKPIPIASLNTILGANIVSANHCQSMVNIKQGFISSIDNERITKICSDTTKKTTGGKKNNTKKNKKSKKKNMKIKTKKNKTKKNKTKKKSKKKIKK